MSKHSITKKQLTKIIIDNISDLYTEHQRETIGRWPPGGAFTGKISPDAANPSAFFLAEYSQINEEQCLEIDNSIISDIKMEV